MTRIIDSTKNISYVIEATSDSENGGESIQSKITKFNLTNSNFLLQALLAEGDDDLTIGFNLLDKITKISYYCKTSIGEGGTIDFEKEINSLMATVENDQLEQKAINYLKSKLKSVIVEVSNLDFGNVRITTSEFGTKISIVINSDEYTSKLFYYLSEVNLDEFVIQIIAQITSNRIAKVRKEVQEEFQSDNDQNQG